MSIEPKEDEIKEVKCLGYDENGISYIVIYKNNEDWEKYEVVKLSKIINFILQKSPPNADFRPFNYKLKDGLKPLNLNNV